ncbi:UvrD-helicase domain-containing protein [Candidatus Microgenomates bacterium]|nr:UvrD-helicase domain-containing protein [Candidatus Microgenomates bacterium]
MKLNKEQQEAVDYQGGPLLIIAGAGTGKTTVITERIKQLIVSEVASPSEILALTFTEKAAREMEERVDIAVPYGYTQMWISTFHAFCDKVLRAEALNIGLSTNYKLMTEAEAIHLLRRNLFSFELSYYRPLGNPTKFVGGMLQHFSRLQDEDISPEQYIKFARECQISNVKFQMDKEEAKKYLELAKAYQKYQELKVKEGVMDFGDLIVNTLLLFRKRPAILAKYQKQFKYMLVDEFQDTNIAQYALMKLLAPPNDGGNLTVIGDDNQSIYKFRGAAISNILQFMSDYKKAKQIILASNYRSTQKILDSSYQLIKNNDPDTLEAKLGVSKKLKKTRTIQEVDVGFIYRDRVENEAEEVAKTIKELVISNKRPIRQAQGKQVTSYEYSDFAILVRANSSAEAFTRALSRAGIPYQFLGPGQLFRQEEVRDLICYLKVLYNFEDSVSLYRVLSMDHFDISARDVAAIINYGRRMNISLFEACEEVDKVFVNPATKEKVKKFVEMVSRHLKLARKESAGQLLYYFLEDTEMIQTLAKTQKTSEEKRSLNISRFFDKLKTYEAEHDDASIAAVVDWIELSMELGESPQAANIDWDKMNAVNILTVHSSKGLEFPVVFLVNLVAGRFPTYGRSEQLPIPDELIKEELPEGDYHVEEERRLFYVGMTRAMDRLYLTAANYYGEGKRERKLSPFVIEALGEDKVTGFRVQGTGSEQLTFFDYSQPAVQSQPLTISHNPLTINYISYSQIAEFKVCPLHYKLKYILRVPMPMSAAQSFGITMHQTLADFYDFSKKDMTVDSLLKIYDRNWIAEGYDSKVHQSLMKTKGVNYLKAYFKNEFSPDKLPILRESPFTFRLNDVSGRHGDLKVGGKIDRVDKTSNGIEIIDYKTGANIPDEKEVAKDLQLTVYALAATEVHESPFGRKPEDVTLSLYYFDNERKLTTTRSREELENAKKEIIETVSEIETSNFECSHSNLCQNCEYKMFCNSLP